MRNPSTKFSTIAVDNAASYQVDPAASSQIAPGPITEEELQRFFSQAKTWKPDPQIKYDLATNTVDLGNIASSIQIKGGISEMPEPRIQFFTYEGLIGGAIGFFFLGMGVANDFTPFYMLAGLGYLALSFVMEYERRRKRHNE